MTHRDHPNEFERNVPAPVDGPGGFQQVMELLIEQGFDGLATAIQILMNEAMEIERSQILTAQRLQANNGPERLNREIKRRARVASIFPNDAPLLRLATAVRMETDDQWQTEKRYLPKVTP